MTRKPACSLANLSDPAAINPGFIADRSGTYEIRLIVNNGATNSEPDFVTITVVALACPTNAVCSVEKFCLKAVGNCSVTGSCTVKPDICTQQHNPVCGCDDQTYSNACIAHSAGVSISHAGECVPPPSSCSSNAECSMNEFCQLAAGKCGGTGSAPSKQSTAWIYGRLFVVVMAKSIAIPVLPRSPVSVFSLQVRVHRN